MEYWQELKPALEGYGVSGVVSIEANCVSETLESIKSPLPGSRTQVYAVVFSGDAARGTLEKRALELSEILRYVANTHRGSICIVSHSAGGLVSRIVAQEVIEGVECPEQLDHVVTIGTPHQGAAIVENIGAAIGVRGTSLSINSPLIVKLNNTDLPPKLRFTSVVVGTFGLDGGKPGNAYSIPYSKERCSSIPRHFLYGGDEVVHAITQNLAFTPTGSRCIERGSEQLKLLGFRCQCPASQLRMWEQFKSTETLHTAVFRSGEFCSIVCALALNKMDAAKIGDLEATCLVQNHIESLIKSEDFTREVVDVTVTNLKRHHGTINFDAIGTWKQWGTETKRFTGKLDASVDPQLGILVAR